MLISNSIFAILLFSACLAFIYGVAFLIRRQVADPATDKILKELGADIIRPGKQYRICQGLVRFEINIAEATTVSDIAVGLISRFKLGSGKVSLSIKTPAPVMSRFMIKRLVLCALPSESVSDFKTRFRCESKDLRGLIEDKEFLKTIKNLVSLNVDSIEHDGNLLLFKIEETELKIIKEILAEIANLYELLNVYTKTYATYPFKEAPHKLLYLFIFIWWISLFLIMFNIACPIGYPALLGVFFLGSVVWSSKTLSNYNNYRFLTSNNVCVSFIVSSCFFIVGVFYASLGLIKII